MSLQKDLKLNRSNTALLVIDIQRDFFSKKDQEDPIDDLQEMNSILKPLNCFIEKIRNLNIPVIFTKYIEEERSIPENILEKHLDGFCKKGSEGEKVFEINVAKEDLIIEKFTWDAFTNPKLEKYLKEKKIKNLIVTGVTTEMCVFSTISSAFAKGYTIIVPSELVATQKKKQEIHEQVMKLTGLYYGFVMKSEDLLSKLTKL